MKAPMQLCTWFGSGSDGIVVCLGFPIPLLMLKPGLDSIVLACGWLSILLIGHVDGSQSPWPPIYASGTVILPVCLMTRCGKGTASTCMQHSRP